MKVLFIINDPPYGTERVYNALRHAHAFDEFDGALNHITSALNLPLGELPGRLIEIKALQDRPVILVCKTDKRSVTAATLLDDAGSAMSAFCAAAWNNGTATAGRSRTMGQPLIQQ